VWVKASNDTLTSTAGILVTPYNYFNPDYRPSGSGPAISGASFTDAPIAANTNTNTGIIESKKNIAYVMVYPNPASQIAQVVINSNIDTKSTISVMDVTGKVLDTYSYNTDLQHGLNELQVNTIELSNGIYFVTVSTGTSKETVKLIVNH
jgi:urease gamma subunit